MSLTNELVQELRRASELFSDDGWWKPEILSAAADEIERLRRIINVAGTWLQTAHPGPYRSELEPLMREITNAHEPGACTCRGCPVHGIPKYMNVEGASRDAPGVVQRVCHALTDNCVMFTDPERPPCTPENCKAVKASRDASPPCPSVHDHMWAPAQDGEYCMRCLAVRTSPADLVGALQDVVHTDPGPVRAAHAVKANDGGPLCSDCPPLGYPTDKTRCDECPRRTART